MFLGEEKKKALFSHKTTLWGTKVDQKMCGSWMETNGLWSKIQILAAPLSVGIGYSNSFGFWILTSVQKDNNSFLI